jgi:hypothetical protein
MIEPGAIFHGLSGAGVRAAETAARNLGVTMFVDAGDARGIRQLADQLKTLLEIRAD